MIHISVRRALNGGPAVLYVATSNSANTGFAVQYYFPDDLNPADGLFDPYLWNNPSTGAWWLLFSQERPSYQSQNYIYAQQLTSDGLNFAGSAYLLIDYTTVHSALSGFNPGGNPFIENPAFVTDPRGTYPFNLVMSFGTWSQAYTYEDTVIACDSITGPCGYNTSEMNTFAGQVASGNRSLVNPAGASFVEGSPQYSEFYMPFAAATSSGTPTSRFPYFDGTNSAVMHAGDTLYAGAYDSGVGFCVCDPNGWELSMQPGGALAITDQHFSLRWSDGKSGGDGRSYAVMQSDGNFVVYDKGVANWATNTAGHPGAYMLFENPTGNMVIYSATGQLLFQTGT